MCTVNNLLLKLNGFIFSSIALTYSFVGNLNISILMPLELLILF